MNTEGNNEVYAANNDGYNNASIIDIRLNTTQFVDQIQDYLSGTITEIIFDEDKPKRETKKVAEPKANAQGIHSIMLYIRSTFNPQIVQGNIESFEALDNIIAYFREDFSKYLMINLNKFSIAENEYEGIIDFIIFSMKNFLSRLVGNKERESFTNTMVTRESSSSHEKERGRGLRIPGFN